MAAEDISRCAIEISHKSKHPEGSMAEKKIPSNYSDNPGAPEDVAGKAKAEAIVEIAHDRTESNQKLLDFYITLFERATQQ